MIECNIDNKCTYIIKIVLLGESGVGKTCILERYIHNTFDSKANTTTTAIFTPKQYCTPDGKSQIQFHIWDTAGQEAYRSLTSFYYRDAHGIFLVYDITSKKSFEALNFWVK